MPSVSHLPAVSVPVGLDRSGLPVGMQVIAAEYRDRGAIAAAGLIERTLGGFKAPPLTKPAPGDVPGSATWKG
jgi:amidase